MGLTEEQAAAVDLFKTSSSLKISAFAGTGKTTTLTALGKSTRKSGLYLAFNKSIATEAQSKFPQTVDCRTTHSLALRSLPNSFRGNSTKLFDSLPGNRIAQILDIEEISVGDVLLKPRATGFLTSKTIQKFCQSGDDQISHKHVPLSGKLERLLPENRLEFEKYIAELASHLWDRMMDPKDVAPLGHDGYLKLWSLLSPPLPYDFILLDEAQDTNEAVLSVLRKQQTQLTLVGDRHQQIYEWRGAVNAMKMIETAAESSLTQSFRFGPEIAEVANRILSDLKETCTLRGNPKIKSEITTTGRGRAVLCRTNAGVIAVVLESLLRQEKPFVVGGVAELIRMLEDVTRLKRAVPAETSDLFGFRDWAEVISFSEEEEGESLRPFVTIVKAYGEAHLINALRTVSSNEGSADLIVSTGHKAKGREWQTVRLHSDFEPKDQKKTKTPTINEEETRLLYVACTRPQSQLIVPSRIATSWGISEDTSLSLVDKAGSIAVPIHIIDAAPTTIPKARPELPSIAKVAAGSGHRKASPAAKLNSRSAVKPISPEQLIELRQLMEDQKSLRSPQAEPQGFFAAIFKSIFK
jgi:UvrD/REP helicase N-terminal domain